MSRAGLPDSHFNMLPGQELAARRKGKNMNRASLTRLNPGRITYCPRFGRQEEKRWQRLAHAIGILRVSTSKHHRIMRGQAPTKLRIIPRGILPRMGGFAGQLTVKLPPGQPVGLKSKHQADRQGIISVSPQGAAIKPLG